MNFFTPFLNNSSIIYNFITETLLALPITLNAATLICLTSALTSTASVYNGESFFGSLPSKVYLNSKPKRK